MEESINPFSSKNDYDLCLVKDQKPDYFILKSAHNVFWVKERERDRQINEEQVEIIQSCLFNKYIFQILSNEEHVIFQLGFQWLTGLRSLIITVWPFIGS